MDHLEALRKFGCAIHVDLIGYQEDGVNAPNTVRKAICPMGIVYVVGHELDDQIFEEEPHVDRRATYHYY